MKDKKVSICIPTYNNREFIVRTIRSVINQTYKNIEIIICDDHSSDNTVEIARSIRDPRINVIENNSNLGLSANWNKSISLASGEYIKLLCGDDILYPQCIEEQVAILDNDSSQNISLVTCLSQVINHFDKVLISRKSVFRRGVNSPKKVVSLCLVIGTNIIGEPMVGMFRRSMIKKHAYNGDNPYMIDLDFWFKLLKEGQLYFINHYLTAFRVSGESLSYSLGFRQARLTRFFMCKARSEFNLSPMYNMTIYLNSMILSFLRNLVFMINKRVIN